MSNAPAISASTRVVCLLGHPVKHSVSPIIHNAAFSYLGLDFVYVAFDVEPLQLPDAITALRALGIRGANVTVPHKERTAGFLDRLEGEAHLLRAVNTIVNNNGLLIGHNTDVEGFRLALEEHWKKPIPETSFAVFGAGGAARAVVAALMQSRAREVYILNRTVERAEQLAKAASAWRQSGGEGNTRIEALPLDYGPQVVSHCSVIINATSVGLHGPLKHHVIPVDKLNNQTHFLMDLVYAPGETELVRQARARGVQAVDGLEMLVFQADLSFSLWTGVAAPINVMRSVVGL